MSKRKDFQNIDSNSEGDDNISDLETDFLFLAKKKQKSSDAHELTSNGWDHEEGEVSSDDSDESTDSRDEFSDGYDDDLMGDDHDRSRLKALTEKERETEIFKRLERREFMKTRWDIERKLRLAKKTEGGQKDSSVSDEQQKKFIADYLNSSPDILNMSHSGESSMIKMKDIDEAKERSIKRKKMLEENQNDDKRIALAQLKAQREDKQKRDEVDKFNKEAEVSNSKILKLKASDVYSDDSDDDDKKTCNTTSVIQKPPHHKKYSSPMFPTSVTTTDLNKIRLSREMIERFVHHPFFDQLVVGCLVRISIGSNAGKLVYRAADVVCAVETAKIYELGNTRTNKGLKIRHGGQSRVFRLEFISNQDLTESELLKWCSACDDAQISIPGLKEIEKKYLEIKEAFGYQLTEAEVSKIIKEKLRFRSHPTNYAIKKTQLMKERDAAIIINNTELVSSLNEEIDKLDKHTTELDNARTSTISNITVINDRNRKMNMELAEKAILEDAAVSKDKQQNDPFTRRSTKPCMKFTGNEENGENNIPQPSKGIRPIEQKLRINPGGADMYALHDFDIEFELEATPPQPIVLKKAFVPKPPDYVGEDGKKRISIEEYRRRHGWPTPATK